MNSNDYMEHHSRATALSLEGDIAHFHGNTDVAIRKYQQAAEAEERALKGVPRRELPVVYDILAASAASLYCKARRPLDAAHVALIHIHSVKTPIYREKLQEIVQKDRLYLVSCSDEFDLEEITGKTHIGRSPVDITPDGRIVPREQLSSIVRSEISTITHSITIDHAQVSVNHAIIEKMEGRWYLRDLGSEHGTLLDVTDQVNEPVELTERSHPITFGNYMEGAFRWLRIGGSLPPKVRAHISQRYIGNPE